MARLNYNKRFSNTGLGQTPTISEVHGLTRGGAKRGKFYSEVKAMLKERALEGDERAAYKYKKLLAARDKQYSSRRPKPTKIKLSFLED